MVETYGQGLISSIGMNFLINIVDGKNPDDILANHSASELQVLALDMETLRKIAAKKYKHVVEGLKNIADELFGSAVYSDYIEKT